MERSQGKSQRKFRSILVAPGFQLLLIVSNCLTVGSLAAFVKMYARKSEVEFLLAGKMAGLNPEHPYFNFANRHISEFNFYLNSGIVIGLLASTVITLFVSHKLAGPFVRLRSYFEGISQTGKVQPLRFRDWDLTGKLDEKINQAMKRVVPGLETRDQEPTETPMTDRDKFAA